MRKQILIDKVAIVTGGAQGIGAGIAEELFNEGAHVILTDLESQLQKMSQKLHDKYTCLHLDVSVESDWNNLIDIIEKTYGRVDLLVNNAGVGGKEGVIDTSIEEWNKVINTNLTGSFLGMQKTVPLLKKTSTSSIVNISSIYGKIGNGEAAAYHASKAALIGLTKTAAVELAPDFIRVNTIHPGVIDTPMIQRKLSQAEINKKLSEYTLLPRFGTPYDIARAVVFLGSDDSHFITGIEMPVDGGYLAH